MNDTCCNLMLDILESMDFDSLEVFKLGGPAMNPETLHRLLSFIAQGGCKKLQEFTIGCIFRSIV